MRFFPVGNSGRTYYRGCIFSVSNLNIFKCLSGQLVFKNATFISFSKTQMTLRQKKLSHPATAVADPLLKKTASELYDII